MHNDVIYSITLDAMHHNLLSFACARKFKLLTVRLRDPSNQSRIVLDRSASAKLLFELNLDWYGRVITYLH